MDWTAAFEQFGIVVILVYVAIQGRDLKHIKELLKDHIKETKDEIRALRNKG